MNFRGLHACPIVLLLAVAACGGKKDAPQPAAGQAAATTQAVPGPVDAVKSATSKGRRVIFVGLDGADWSLLDRYVAAGTMPNLKRLLAEGASGTLDTISPPLSPLIWTTMMTGVSPLQHRVLDFLRVNPATSRPEPITSDERKAPAIWNMATNGGKTVAVFGLWATYPAEAVNGLMVSDRLFTFLYSESQPPPRAVFPESAESWARQGLKQAQDGVGFEEVRAYLPWLTKAEYDTATATVDPYAHPVSALRRILVETRVYDTLARDWIAREHPDLAAVYIQGTDSIGHVFAPYAPPRQPSVSPADYERYKDVPAQFFQSLDRMLGSYIELARSTGSVLMLASDHGFQWGEGRPATLSSAANTTAAKWHSKEGIYLLWGPGVTSSGGHVNHGSVTQVCATLLALAGLPAGKGLSGPALPGAGTPSSQTVDYAVYYSPAAPAAPASAQASSADDDAIEKLRALGYIGAAGGSGGRPFGTRTGGSLNNEGLLLKAEGKTKEAADAFDTAISVDPNLASALWNLSDMLFAEGAQLDKSDDLLVRAYAHGLPEGTKFLIGRAIGYQRDGKVTRSIALLNQAIAARADDPELWLFRGRYKVERNDCGSAVTDFQQAVKLVPTNAAAFASLGLAQSCAGDAAAARASFEQSLRLDPNQPRVRAFLEGR
jgi:Tfp pilus assembly protein PilF